MDVRLFTNRTEAGERLAERLRDTGAKRPLVLALPRGGLPVALPIAKLLECPLDTLVVRKVGTLFNPEFAVGAVGPHEVKLLDEEWLKASNAPHAAYEAVIEQERTEMRRRIDAYKSGTYSAGYMPDLVIIVDDGVATGLTARAAVLSARARYPKTRIVFVTPVSVGGELDKVREIADEVVCIAEPRGLYAVGQAYRDFPAVSDAEVIKMLSSAKKAN